MEQNMLKAQEKFRETGEHAEKLAMNAHKLSEKAGLCGLDVLISKTRKRIEESPTNTAFSEKNHQKTAQIDR